MHQKVKCLSRLWLPGAQLASDPGATFDAVHEINVSGIGPQVTWGVNPGMVADVNGTVPDPAAQQDPLKRQAYERALKYMDLKPGQKITEINLDTVFIGSCTNSRLEDLRMAAQYVKGKHVAPNVRAMVVPGSMQVRLMAEEEGIADIFREAGFDWREAGCSMCIAMNGDRLSEGERCASTSNRNFEGRQGRGGRTHLVSPAMAAAAASGRTLCRYPRYVILTCDVRIRDALYRTDARKGPQFA